jgi:hypothetical protein
MLSIDTDTLPTYDRKCGTNITKGTLSEVSTGSPLKVKFR